MISIKKRIIIRRTTATLSLLVSATIVIFVICILPSGIHSKNITDLAIAEDVDLYIGTKSIDDNILKKLNSTQTDQILNKNLQKSFDTMLKNVDDFSSVIFYTNAIFSSQFIRNRMHKFVNSRSAAFMIWGRNAAYDLSDARKYLLFDVGFALGFVFNNIIFYNEVVEIANKYKISKISYYKINIFTISILSNSNSHLYFVIHKGKLVFTDTKEGIKKIVEHLSSNVSKISNVAHLNAIATKFSPYVSFYATDWAYQKMFNTDIEILNGQDFSSLYGYANSNKNGVYINMHLISRGTTVSNSRNAKNNRLLKSFVDTGVNNTTLEKEFRSSKIDIQKGGYIFKSNKADGLPNFLWKDDNATIGNYNGLLSQVYFDRNIITIEMRFLK